MVLSIQMGLSDFHEIQHFKKRAFLAAFSRCGSISKAAKRAKVDRGSHYHWMETDPEYPDIFQRAREQGLDAVEDMLHEEAIEARNITAAIFLLKGGRPEKYSDRWKGELTGKDGSPLFTQQNLEAWLRGAPHSD